MSIPAHLDLSDALRFARRGDLPVYTPSESPIYPTPAHSYEQSWAESEELDGCHFEESQGPDPITYVYEDDIFSPPYWAQDGLDIYPNEVNATLEEFRNCTIRSESLGKNFGSRLPDDSEIREFLKKTPLYHSRHKRWHHLPTRCRDVRELFRPMRDVIDAVCEAFGSVHARPVVDSFHIPPSALEFRTQHQQPGPMYRLEPLKRLPHFMALGLEGSNFGPIPSPFESGPSYTSMISPVELQIDANLNFNSDLSQLALYARQCFICQGNRTFVYALLITETHVQLYVFDRSGVCHSCPLDIHACAVDFVRMLLGVWSPEDQHVGFDTSIYWEQNAGGVWDRYIESFDEDGDKHSYRLSPPYPTMSRWYVEGRGTTCWLTTDDGRELLIKDSWRDVAQSSESGLLNGARGLRGVGQMIAAEQGERISTLRGIPPRPPSFVDRRFSRTILQNYGPATIADFQSRTDLLLGLRDAIVGHQRLWDAGILHGDISMDNILLTSRRYPGESGVLIDLDMAMWVDPSRAPGPVVFHNMGTRAYVSLNVLESYPTPPRTFTRDHLDDLESFYYMLCDICSTFTGPGQRLPKPEFIQQWEYYDTKTAAASKMGSLLFADYEPTPYFGPIFEELLDRLHTFFAKAAGRKRVEVARRRHTGALAPSWYDLQFTSSADYATVLRFIDQAIYELQVGKYVPAGSAAAQDAYRSRTLSLAGLVPLPALPWNDRPLSTVRYANARKRAAHDSLEQDSPPKRFKMN